MSLYLRTKSLEAYLFIVESLCATQRKTLWPRDSLINALLLFLYKSKPMEPL